MKKIITILLVALCACQSNTLTSDSELAASIESRFLTTAFQVTASTIDLSNLDDFAWDNMLILGPYTSIAQTEKDLNIDLGNINGDKIAESDAINLMIFFQNNEAVKMAEISRGIGDFPDLSVMIEKGRAKFVKTQSGDNQLIKQ